MNHLPKQPTSSKIGWLHASLLATRKIRSTASWFITFRRQNENPRSNSLYQLKVDFSPITIGASKTPRDHHNQSLHAPVGCAIRMVSVITHPICKDKGTLEKRYEQYQKCALLMPRCRGCPLRVWRNPAAQSDKDHRGSRGPPSIPRSWSC